MTDPLSDENDRRAEAAEYVLRLMSPAEEMAFEERLSTDSKLEREVAEWVALLAPLSDEIEPIAPPKAVFERLQTDLFGAPETPSLWHRVSLWRPIALVATACAALMALFITFQSPAPESSTILSKVEHVGELASDDGSLRLLAAYDAVTGELRLTRTDGAPAQGRDFELWAVLGDGNPRSLGLLADGRSSTIAIAEELRASIPDVTLAVSDEPDGGSTTGLPTGPVLALGGLTDL